MSFVGNKILRNGLAVLAGLGVGSAVNMALITLNTSVLFPMPAGVTFDNAAAFGEYIRSLPLAAYITVFLAHYSQAVVGGYLAARLACCEKSAAVACYLVSGLTMVGAIVNAATLPVPAWTWVEIPVFPVLAYYTAKWAVSAMKTTNSKSS